MLLRSDLVFSPPPLSASVAARACLLRVRYTIVFSLVCDVAFCMRRAGCAASMTQGLSMPPSAMSMRSVRAQSPTHGMLLSWVLLLISLWLLLCACSFLFRACHRRPCLRRKKASARPCSVLSRMYVHRPLRLLALRVADNSIELTYLVGLSFARTRVRPAGGGTYP